MNDSMPMEGANSPCRPNGSGRGFDRRKKLQSLWKLIAAGQTKPSLLHIQEVLPELGARCETGLICALLGVQTALARFPTHAYKHGGPSKGPPTSQGLQYRVYLGLGQSRNQGKEEMRRSVRGERACAACLELACWNKIFHLQRQRFRPKPISPSVDFIRQVALLADLHGEIIGGARYYIWSPGQADIAFIVGDAYQNKASPQ